MPVASSTRPSRHRANTHAGCLAHRGLALIQKLYGVEKAVRHATPEVRYAHRQLHAQPILDELRTWLDESLPQVPPQSATGKALYYLHNE